MIKQFTQLRKDFSRVKNMAATNSFKQWRLRKTTNFASSIRARG